MAIVAIGESAPVVTAIEARFSGPDERAVARERVKQAIRKLIALGELAPDQQVVETQIAATLGVSRTPVREALRELEQQGLVVSYPHRGSFIRSLTPKDVEDATYARAAVEGMAARLAVEHASRAEVRQLERLVEEMGKLHDADVLGVVQFIDLELHETLVSLSGNERLLRLWRTFDPLLWVILGNSYRRHAESVVPDLSEMVARHQRVVAAILSGDPDEAEQTVRSHVVSSGLSVAEIMRGARPVGPVREVARDAEPG